MTSSTATCDLEQRCTLCTDVIRIRVVVPCSHDHVCGICVGRMRLRENLKCPICRMKWEYVVFTFPNRIRSILQYDLNQFHYDKQYSAYFDTKELAWWFKKLRSNYCMYITLIFVCVFLRSLLVGYV